MLSVRDVDDSDHGPLGVLAAACGQTGPFSAQDPAYVAAVADAGRFVVAADGDALVGFAGVVHRAAVAFLTDLFVLPSGQGRGAGSALLRTVWDGTSERATSSSTNAVALTSYVRWGLVPAWPLLYLEVAGEARPWPDDVARSSRFPADLGWPVPSDDLLVLDVGRTAGAVLAHDTRGAAVLRAEVEGTSDFELLLRAARAAAGADGVARLQVPGAHQGLDAAMVAGAVVVDTDVWCATPGAIDLWDPRAVLPSPSFG
jgi:GNAT superfamily N-acetyltransferase